MATRRGDSWNRHERARRTDAEGTLRERAVVGCGGQQCARGSGGTYSGLALSGIVVKVWISEDRRDPAGEKVSGGVN